MLHCQMKVCEKWLNVVSEIFWLISSVQQEANNQKGLRTGNLTSFDLKGESEQGNCTIGDKEDLSLCSCLKSAT